MAKQEKKRNKKYKKYKQNYVTGGRVDMRTGGRVGYQIGKMVEEPRVDKMSVEREDTPQVTKPNKVDRQPISPDTQPVSPDTQPISPGAPAWWKKLGYGSLAEARAAGWIFDKETGEPIFIGSGGTNDDDGTDDNNTTTTSDLQGAIDPNRTERVQATGEQAQRIAAGDFTGVNLPQIPDAQTLIDPETGLPAESTELDPASEAFKMQQTQAARAAGVAGVSQEQVSQGQATTAQPTQMADAAQITQDELTTVSDRDVAADVAQGQVSRETTDVDVNRVGDLDSTQVEIEPGAVANRVVGVLSPEAKATAATNAGTSLSRITRAKKQLSRAGLSDEDINTIGNDPEALEDRLADFSEEERGVIAGLPEEALVSTQLNGLLEGMENGEIPIWARPAVASVEAMLARRGLSASSVGRDNLFNAIVQSAMPIAQSNAQAIQQSVTQQRTIEAQTAEANAQRMQQTALANSSNVFKLNMAQFSADQQTELSNSKFLQTVSVAEASAEQQSIIQSAVLLSQANIAEANLNQKSQIENAKNFLAMDMANLSNQQQANMLKAQQEQQRLLSDQAAQNAAAQFNATSENQTNQFMANLAQNQSQFNASQLNSMEQFNIQALNVAEARRVGNEVEAARLEAQLKTDVSKFNSQLDAQREEFNTRNETTIAQSNVAWRRQANTADTAAQNAINQQNAQNAFGLTASSMNFLWQELRDEADFNFRRWDNDQTRKTSIYTAALGNDTGASTESNWSSNLSAIGTLINGWLSND